jgi:hypothetical protein
MWQNILGHCAVFTKVSEEFAPHYLAEIRHDMRQTTESAIDRAKVSPKPWDWAQAHETGCCSPVGEHLRVQVLPD